MTFLSHGMLTGLVALLAAPGQAQGLRDGALLQEDRQLLAELTRQIDHIAAMHRSGEGRQAIAKYVAELVDERIIAINRNDVDEAGVPGPEHGVMSAFLKGWCKEFTLESQSPWISAHWAWKHRIGNCQEHSYLCYHLLMQGLHKGGMADPGSQLRVFTCGDHAFLIWGDTAAAKMPKALTAEEFRRRGDLCLIDAWVGVGGSGDQVLHDVKALREIEEKRITKVMGLRLKRTITGGWIVRDDEMGFERWFPTTPPHSPLTTAIYEQELEWWLTRAVQFAGRYECGPTEEIEIQQSGFQLTMKRGETTVRGRARGRRAYFDQIVSGPGTVPIVALAHPTDPVNPVLRHMKSGVPARAMVIRLQSYAGEDTKLEKVTSHHGRIPDDRLTTLPFKRCGGGLKVQIPSPSGDSSSENSYGSDSMGSFTGASYKGTWSRKERTSETTNSVTATLAFENGLAKSVLRSFKAVQIHTEKRFRKGEWKLVSRTVTTITATNLPLDKRSPMLLVAPIEKLVRAPEHYPLRGRYVPLIYKVKGSATIKHATLLRQYTDLETGETTTTSAFTCDDESEITVLFMFQ